MHRRARSDAVSRSATALCDRDQAGVGHHDAEGGEDGSGSGAPRDGARAQSAAARDAKLAKKESRIAALLEDAIDEPEGGGRHGVRPGSAATRLQGRRGAPGQRPARRRRDKSRNSADGADVGAAPASVAAAGPAARAARRPASAQPTGGGLKAVRARRSGVLEPQGHKRAPQRALDASPLSPRPGTASPSGAGLVDSMAASRRTRRRPRPATATATPNPGGRSPSRGGSVTFAAAADAGPTHRSRPSSAHYLKMAEERRRKREAAFAAALLDEEMQLARQCAAWSREATEWAQRLGLKRSYQQAVGSDGMTVVVAHGEGGHAKEMRPREFQREREKLRNMLERERYRPPSKRSGAGGDEEAPSGEGAGQEEGAKPRQSRAQVQDELQALLRDTTALTERLHSQLAELSKRGWNAI